MATHSSILAWRIPMDRGAWRATVRGVTNRGDGVVERFADDHIAVTGHPCEGEDLIPPSPKKWVVKSCVMQFL